MDQYLDNTQKKRLYGVVMAVIVLLAVFLAVKSLSAIKEYSYIGRGTYASNVIAVTGKGEVAAKPDIATFSFSIVESGKTIKAAQDLATAKENAVLASLKEMGIEDKDVQTSGYNSYPKYEYQQASTICANGYCPPGKQVLTGYEVNETITVKVRNTDKAGDVLTKVGSLGVSNISGINFTIDDIDTLKAQARDEAIKDAKSKADALAKSLGVKLKKVANFYESGDQPIPMYAAYDSAGMGMGKSVMMEAQAAPSLPTGENKVTSNVTITYEIE